MSELGFQVARRILKHERESGRATVILLLIALDSAYNSVLAFTSVLNLFIGDLYKLANNEPDDVALACNWTCIQELAFDDSEKARKALTDIILEAQRKSVKLPIIRKAVKTHT